MTYIAEIDKDRPRRSRDEGFTDRELGGVLSITIPRGSGGQGGASARPPQAILKIQSFGRNAQVKKLMHYIGRTGKDDELALENESGERLEGREKVENEYQHWREDFERAKPGQENPGRHATHMILTAKVGSEGRDVEKLRTATREFLHENYGKQGYEYVWGIHTDTDYPHAHVIVKNRNRELQKKLRIDKADLFHQRSEYARTLSAHGLEHVATKRRDDPEVLRDVAAGKQDLKAAKPWMIRKLEAPTGRTIDRADFRKRQSLAMREIRQQIKKEMPRGEKRTELLGHLKEARKSFLKGEDKALSKNLNQMVRRLDKDTGHLKSGIEAIEKPPKSKPKDPKKARAEQKRREQALGAFAERHSRQLDRTIRQVQKADLPRKDKRQALRGLRQNQKILAKIRPKQRGKGLER